VIDTRDSLIDIADRVIDVPGPGSTSGVSDRQPMIRPLSGMIPESFRNDSGIIPESFHMTNASNATVGGGGRLTE